MNEEQPLRQGEILTGPLFNEPMRVETVRADGSDIWVAGLVGTLSERFRKVTLTPRDLESLKILDVNYSYDGDGSLLRLGLQAYALGIAPLLPAHFRAGKDPKLMGAPLSGGGLTHDVCRSTHTENQPGGRALLPPHPGGGPGGQG